MTGSRDEVISAIRNGLGVSADDKVRSAAVADRLKRHPESTVPARAEGDAKELEERFAEMLEGQHATLHWAKSKADVPQAIASYLRELNMPARARVGEDDLLDALPWEQAPALEISKGPARPDDEVGITRASCAAAETGTLFVTSGPENPTSLNFLPENHIAVIRKSDILGSYEAVWSRLRERYGNGVLPRAVNLISGPSRTADIEQTMVMGAHGPRRLHVIVVG